jgi:hypothetical protein
MDIFCSCLAYDQADRPPLTRLVDRCQPVIGVWNSHFGNATPDLKPLRQSPEDLIEIFLVDDATVQSFLSITRQRLQYANDGSESFTSKMSLEDRKRRLLFYHQDLCRQWSIVDYSFQRGIPPPLNSDYMAM